MQVVAEPMQWLWLKNPNALFAECLFQLRPTSAGMIGGLSRDMRHRKGLHGTARSLTPHWLRCQERVLQLGSILQNIRQVIC
jgi:hypothetical protein